jgi:hypothetical protein
MMHEWFVVVRSFDDWNIIHRSLGKKSAEAFLSNYDNRFGREIRLLTSEEFSLTQREETQKRFEQSQARSIA